MGLDRSKYMDVAEAKLLLTSTAARAMKDLAAGRKGGVLGWALVDTALHTGLRVCELAAIKCGDLDPKRSALRVTRRKRKKPLTETLPIPSQLVDHLQQFIAWKAERQQPIDPAAPLFVGKQGPLTAQGLQLIWKRAIRDAELPRELSIHSARHTFGTIYTNKNRNVRLTQKHLGHVSPITTANIYAHVTFEQMKDAVEGLYE